MLNFPGILPPTELKLRLEEDLARTLVEIRELDIRLAMLADQRRLLAGLLKLAKEPNPEQGADYVI